MGGRGSSSSGTKAYDVGSIKSTLTSNNIRLVGSKHISGKGTGTVGEIVGSIKHLESKFGKAFDTVLIVDSKSPISFKSNLKANLKSGGTMNLGNTLIISKSVANGGSDALKISFSKGTVKRNLGKQVAYSYGNALYSKMKNTNPKLYKEFNAKIKNYVSRPSAKTKVGNRTYSSPEGYVRESVYHLVSNRKSAKGQDMVDLTREYLSKLPNVSFDRYGMKPRQTVAVGGRKRRRK